MGHHNHIEIKEEHYKFGKKAKTWSLAILGVGVILFLIGIFTLPKHDILVSENHKTATKERYEEYKKEHNFGTAHAVDREGETAPAAHEEEHAAEEAGHGNDQHWNGGEEHHDGHHAGFQHTKPWTARIWSNIMMNSYFFLIISACALFFVALQYISNAGWATVVKRIPEAILTVLPYFLGTLLLALIIGKDQIYYWAEYFTAKGTDHEMPYDKLVEGKSGFLNTGWLWFGVAAIVGVWIYFGWRLRTLSKQEDALENHNRATKSKQFIFSIRNSAAFTVIFGFTLSILSWLIVMSVDAHWFSTIFSIYNFAVGWVSALAVITLFVLFLKKMGYLKLVTDEHIHDLGKFMFAFTIFWGYIWVAQYLLIWYSNIPEEVFYYDTRYYPEWNLNFGLNIVLNFAAPFLILMTRDAKRNPVTLVIAAACILIGKWNDLYLMIMPGTVGPAGGIGLLEIGTTLMFAGFFIFMVQRRLTKQSLVPVNHPYVEESVHHDVGP